MVCSVSDRKSVCTFITVIRVYLHWYQMVECVSPFSCRDYHCYRSEIYSLSIYCSLLGVFIGHHYYYFIIRSVRCLLWCVIFFSTNFLKSYRYIIFFNCYSCCFSSSHIEHNTATSYY